MVMILRAIHPNFEHVRDQLLTGHKSREDLTIRLLRVPTLQRKNVQEPSKSPVTVSTRGRGGQNARGERSGRGHPQCTYCKRISHIQENCFSLHDFPEKTTNICKIEVVEPKFLDEEYQEN